MFSGDKEAFLEQLRQALFASKICSYAQGYQLMRAAAAEYDWDLNYGEIALMWRGGCIIRAQFLGNIKEAYDNNPGLQNLLLDDYFKDAVENSQMAWRKVIATAVDMVFPCPPSVRPWPITTATAARFCPPTCCRHSATISVLTPMSASTNQPASISTPTGPAPAAIPYRQPTTFEWIENELIEYT